MTLKKFNFQNISKNIKRDKQHFEFVKVLVSVTFPLKKMLKK